jgi:hypothetical protein
MLKRILSFLFLLSFFYANAQQLNHVQGEVIVQIEPKVVDITSLLSKFEEFKGRTTKIKPKKCLSKTMNIWLLKFDFTSIHDRRFLRHLQKNRLIQIAQFNHVIKYRKTPNDPDFMAQWQYINSGADEGVENADLDADLAWDITTGGLTPNGDTIVLAALDDGVDLEHEDFGNNLWKNHAEIPDNGIDDDNNGYIDDYHGWNILSDDDQLSSGSHGTPVMGIMGAKGDNGIGLTGINWDVKVMMIQTEFQTDEASIIAGYGYPLEMRKLYNETNGEQGAFVVATNASWGIDEGQPDDAPIWCALYDSLGAAGIINCGATANENFNVDEVGDLPTTCPSDYLIGITNLNRRGEKEFLAGYGKKHIDIAAFGEDTYTLANGNRYAGFGGTSGATPHVTGAIGLLYSAPCPNFSNLTKADPAAAALLAKSYILNGARPNDFLDSLTATGGQLNLFNSLNLLMADCGPCPPALSLNATEITDVSLKLTWLSSTEELEAILRYRPVGTTDWIDMEGVRSPFVFSDLEACTDYEFQLKSICEEESSDFSASYFIKTDGCCDPPSNIKLDSISETSFKVLWEPLFAAKSYEVQLKEVRGAIMQTLSTTDPFYKFNNLESCLDYEVQIRTICENKTTEFTNPILLRTKGCGSCTDADYCEGRGDGEFEWITKVSLNTLVNESGSDKGYGDYTGMSTDLNPLEPYELIVNMAYESFPFVENVQVWIDLNQDGVFDTETEAIVDLDEDVASELKTTIMIPFDAKPGLTRMRVAMKWREGPNPDKPTPCMSFDFGEVEDYCVNILPLKSPCFPPRNIRLLDKPLATVAVLEWEEGLGALKYNYRYRAEGTTDWTEVQNADAISNFLTNLEACTVYEFQAQSACDSMKLSDYSEVFTFNTFCECAPPVNLVLVDSTATTLSLEWDAIDAANKYEVLYKKANSNAPNNNNTRIVVNNNKVVLSSLEECTDYDVTIRGFCLDTNGNSSNPFTVRTDCGVAITSVPKDIDQLSVFPNPMQDQLQVRVELNSPSALHFQLLNTKGQLLINRKIDKSFKGEKIINFDLENWPQGVYLLRLETERGNTVRRIVKM